MNTEKIASEFNVDLDIVNNLQLAAFSLYDREGWILLTEYEQEKVISLLVAKYQFERMRHDIMKLNEYQQNNVANLIFALDATETD